MAWKKACTKIALWSGIDCNQKSRYATHFLEVDSPVNRNVAALF